MESATATLRCACGGQIILSAEHPRDAEIATALVCLGCETHVPGSAEQVECAVAAAMARIRQLDRWGSWAARRARLLASERATGWVYTARRVRRARQRRLRFSEVCNG